MSSSRDLLETLVAFDTTSRESNLHLIEKTKREIRLKLGYNF